MSQDPLALLGRAVNQAGTVIGAVRQDQAGLPTPCRSWDVRALVEHLINDAGQFTAAARGTRPDFRTPAPAVQGDWGAAFGERAERLLSAWRDAGDLSATISLPIGDVPVSFVVSQQVAEFAVHAWDLVRATGQDTSLDPEVGQFALGWAGTALRPEYRGDEGSGQSFGPEVPIAEDAPVYDRLAAFFGRDPGSVPSG